MGKCKDDALHKGEVCGSGCLTNALLGHAFTAVRMKEKGGGPGALLLWPKLVCSSVINYTKIAKKVI